MRNLSHDACGRRVARVTPAGTDTFFYDMGGRLLATYPWSNPNYPQYQRYFAGQKLGQYTDRVGSVRYASAVTSHYYPYGELVIGNNNTGVKFAETYRDDSGFDYAMNRYYASGIGRFLSVDPYGGSARPRLPQSWNRYAYVRNDPANAVDPTGLFTQKKPGSAFKSGSLDCYFDNAGYACQWAYMDGGGEIYDGPMVEEYLPDEGAGKPFLQYWAETQALIAADILDVDADCASLFPAGFNPGEVPRTHVEAGDIRVVPFDEENVNPTVGAQTNQRVGAIYIASNRYFFTGVLADGSRALDSSAFKGLTMQAMQQTIIIHELLHLGGLVGADNANQKITLPNGQEVTGSLGVTLAVKEHCFGVKNE